MSGLLRRAWGVRLVRFGAVGVVCTGLQEIVLVTLVYFDVIGALANGIGFILGAQLSYFLSSRVTWGDSTDVTGARATLRWTTFNLVACAALAASTATYLTMERYFDVRPLLASLFGVVIGTVVTFLANHNLTFRRPPAAEPIERGELMSDIDLSIVVPAYREASRIGGTLERLACFLRFVDLGVVEVVVVAAECNDGTAGIAASKEHLFKHFKLVHAGPKVGKGRDVALGMLNASGRYRMFMDTDLATPLRHLLQVKAVMDRGDTIGVGVRNVGTYHNSLARNLLSRITSLVTRALIAPEVTDTQCGFKVFEASLAEELFSRMRLLQWNFDMEVLALARKLGHRIVTFTIPDWADPKPEDEGLVGDSRLAAILRGAVDPFKVRLNIMTGRYFANHGPMVSYVTDVKAAA